MPRSKSDGKAVYVDTNVVLDVLLKRNPHSTSVIESIRSRKWTAITSTFGMIEMADWKKRDLFIRNKLELNWGMDAIFNQRNRTDLGDYEFKKVEQWLLASGQTIKLEFRDLEGAAWQWVRDISSNTNLLAKDAIHLGTALVSALNSQCDVFVTGDGDLLKEANKYIRRKRMRQKLEIVTPKEFVRRFPPSY